MNVLKHYAGGQVKKLKQNFYVHKQLLKTIIPFLFTFANAFFGFFSIIKTLEGNFVAASVCIIFAAVMDMCDGRLARYWGTTGQLGTELDSLCDAVSFCLAPAVLLYSWYLSGFGHVGFFVSALTLYVCAGLLRLARFNTIASDQTVFFLGLPTTIAAFFFAQLILYQELVAESSLDIVLTEKVMVGLVAFIALLMISTLRFPAFKKMNIAWKKATTYVKIALLLGVIVWSAQHGYPIVLGCVALYIMGGVCFNGWIKAFSASSNRNN